MEDYLSCCRLCLSPRPDNLDLFGVICMAQMIPQKILCILSILVHPQDSMPQQICPQCLENVKQYYKFHRISSCSTAHLLTFLEKDEDIPKNVYANMLKAFQKKNYSNLAGDKSYESLLQEKFDEVKNSVYDLTRSFLDTKKFSLEMMNPVPVAASNSRNRISPNVADKVVPAVLKIDHSTTPTQSPKDPAEKSIKKAAPKLMTKKCPEKKQDIQVKQRCSHKEISVSKRSNKPFVELAGPSEVPTKIELLKLFRCKYCQSAFPTRDDALRHESSAHRCSVKLNTYHGPNNLQLEEDYINQTKKLSWPHKKRRTRAPIDQKFISPLSESSLQKDTTEKEMKNKSTKKMEINNKFTPGRKRPLNADDVNLDSKSLIFSELNPSKRRRKAGPKSRTICLPKIPILTSNHNVDTKEVPPLVSMNLKKRVSPKSKSIKQKSDVLTKLYFESKCKYCKYEFNTITSKDFLKHLNIEKCSSITPYTCSLCREDFTGRKDTFLEHKENCCMTRYFSQELICSKCTQYVGSKSLEDHLVDSHNSLFKCFICSCEFNQKCDLLDHLLKCTFKPTLQSTFTCDTCREVFQSLKDLKTHTLDKHTNHYLNCEKSLSLNYNHTFDWTESKKTACNVLRYQIDSYKSCNSKGSFFCGIKDCKKVLTTIFELESHIQGHCEKRKKKTKAKGRQKKQTINNSNVSYYRTISICDDYFMKKKAELPSTPIEENVDVKAKDKFLSNFGLKNSYENQEERKLDVNIVLDNLGINCAAPDSSGIFELSSNAQGVLCWAGASEKKDSTSPEIVTLDSDDD